MTSAARQIGAVAVVTICLCVGMTRLFVVPAQNGLRQARAEAARSEREIAAAAMAPAQDVERLRLKSLAMRDEIEARSAASASQAGLYASVMALAVRHGLRVDVFQPGDAPATTAASSASPAPAVPDLFVGTGVTHVKSPYTLTVFGGFQGVVRFLDEFAASRFFVTTRRVRLERVVADSRGGVRAEIVADFHQFRFDPGLASASGTPSEVAP